MFWLSVSHKGDYSTFSDSPLVLVDELPDLTVLLLNARAFLKDFLF